MKNNFKINNRIHFGSFAKGTVLSFFLLVFGSLTLPAQTADCYADQVVSSLMLGCVNDPEFSDPTVTLGPPNWTLLTPDSYSMGSRNSELVLAFTDNTVTNSGDGAPDLRIYERGDPEHTWVWLLPSNASTANALTALGLTSDTDGFFFFSSAAGIYNLDIDTYTGGAAAGTLTFSQIKLVTRFYHGCSGYAGPDIDAVCALIDNDGDGVTECDGDCDDNDATVYPGATEMCDGIDNDCDGSVDEGFADTDGDTIADCIDPDDDNDGIEDGCDTAPLVHNFIFNGIDENFPEQWLCGNNNDKVKVCQVPSGNPSNAHTICVSPNAVQAHLDQGDMLGECNPCGGSPYSASNENDIDKHADMATELEVFPNPVRDVLNVHLHGADLHKAQIMIYDGLGKIVWQKNLEEQQTTLQIDLSGSSFMTGIYMVTMISEEEIIYKRIMISK